ncbi:hypothetical protein CTI12_AA381530 [Artemisia annua]|uniref:Uncharacterized protein n=1 Tax=Artemisia annua TaxID=35608 RepID=A0A2U1LLU0_ARTAN|nr:hypothetical protein CTI12_AA381530 [Artemisia annua]
MSRLMHTLESQAIERVLYKCDIPVQFSIDIGCVAAKRGTGTTDLGSGIHARAGLRSVCARLTMVTSQNYPSTNTPHQHPPATASFGEGPSSAGIQDSLPAYDDIGDCDQRCRHYGAAFRYEERLKGHSKSARPEYHSYCRGGKIFMHPEPEPPDYIKTLLQDKHFIELLVRKAKSIGKAAVDDQWLLQN